jgi:hypothetical protein
LNPASTDIFSFASSSRGAMVDVARYAFNLSAWNELAGVDVRRRGGGRARAPARPVPTP